MMTLRELCAENRRRRLAGLREVDRDGQEHVRRPSPPIHHMTEDEAARVYAEIRATYDPSSPDYRHYQGD